MSGVSKPPGFTAEQLREAFFNFDTDRDGAISVEDLKVILMSKGAKMSREEADEMLGEIDFDHDGWVMYDEVCQYLMQGDD